MEKFGIFELLDTLSAIVAADSPVHEEHTEEGSAQNQSGTEPKTAKPNPGDAAYQPPQYTQGEASAETAVGGRDALGAFLDRHDAISRKIDGNRRD